jgi:hypothetical protein
MEHHPGNMGPPQGPMSNEMAFAQHQNSGHNVPHHVFSHNSPTHNNSRMSFTPLNQPPATRIAHPQSDNILSGEPISENGSSSDSVSADLTSVITAIESSAASCNGRDSPTVKQNREKESHKAPNSSHTSASLTPLMNGDASFHNKSTVEITAKNSTGDSRVSEVQNVKAVEDQSSVKTRNKSNSKTDATFNEPSTVDVDVKVKPSIEKVRLTPSSTNGKADINNDVASDKLSIKNRDISADPENSATMEGKRDTEKSSVNNSNSKPDPKSKGQSIGSSKSDNVIQTVEVSSKTTSSSGSNEGDKRMIDGPSASGDYPNLSNSSAPPKPAVKAPEPACAKTWANIASVKTPNIPNDGATATRPVYNAVEGGSVNSYSNDSAYYKSNDQFVPSHHDDNSGSRNSNYDSFDASSLVDENDPIAIRLGEHLQKYSLDHRSIPLAPRGLCNQSNYCFLNATLQV